jgi:hypothetical protein
MLYHGLHGKVASRVHIARVGRALGIFCRSLGARIRTRMTVIENIVSVSWSAVSSPCASTWWGVLQPKHSSMYVLWWWRMA